MDNIPPEHGTSIPGPFSAHRLIVNGYRVPNVEVHPLTGGDDGTYNLVLDERIIVACTRDELDKWAWIVANAMAIGAGYSCHGENSQKMNPYKVRCVGLSVVV